MPVAHPNMRPRLPQAPFPLTNGTAAVTSKSTTLTSRNTPVATRADETKQAAGTQTSAQTPSSIPSPSYASIVVAPVGALAPETTSYSSLPAYSGPGNAILRGHCTEPGYTILDGPATALWVPVVGCISSKAECCPQPTTSQDNAPPAQSQSSNNKKPGNGSNEGGRAAFPISSLPSQGDIKGCPNDYHTVTASDGIACCPSSYWLWSTQIGGQTPCYSSLAKAMVPPPIPETLVFNNMGGMTRPASTSIDSNNPGLGGSITPTPFPRPSAPLGPQKPTSAIVNIAYAMQYKLAPDDSPPISQGAKIGIAIGAAAGGVLVLAIIAILIKKYGCLKRQRTKTGGYEQSSTAQRFSSQVDMSRVAHENPGVARSQDGLKYGSVSTRPVEYRD